MTFNLSPQMRIVALVAGLAALAMPVGFFVMGRQASSAPEVHDIKPLYAGKKQAAVAPAKPAAKAKKAAHPAKKPAAIATKPAKPAATAKPAPAKPAAKPKPKPKPAKPRVPNPNALPAAIALALVAHDVVVVTLYDPEAKVDQYSVDEARAGAKLAGVGFVALNVLEQAQAGPLMRKLGVLPDPALLIFRKPGDLVLRVDGFVDRDTVAQAAANVSPAPVATPAS